IDRGWIEIGHLGARLDRPVGVKGLRESWKRYVLRLDRAGSRAGRRNIDKALEPRRPGAKPAHPILCADDAIADRPQLIGVAHRTEEEEAIPRISAPLPEPELELRFGQIRSPTPASDVEVIGLPTASAEAAKARTISLSSAIVADI